MCDNNALRCNVMPAYDATATAYLELVLFLSPIDGGGKRDTRLTRRAREEETLYYVGCVPKLNPLHPSLPPLREGANSTSRDRKRCGARSANYI